MCRRNELVALDLVVTAVAGSFAFISMIGGVYGMNLKNTMVGNLFAERALCKKHENLSALLLLCRRKAILHLSG